MPRTKRIIEEITMRELLNRCVHSLPPEGIEKVIGHRLTPVDWEDLTMVRVSFENKSGRPTPGTRILGPVGAEPEPETPPADDSEPAVETPDEEPETPPADVEPERAVPPE